MAKPERTWEVTRHDPIEKHDENLWTVLGDVPGNKGDRRMVIAKMSDGRLAFYNAIPLDDAAMKEVEAWGKPSFLILPYNLHMMDGHAFAERLQLKVYGPKSDTKMAARVKLEGGFEDFPKDATVRVEYAAGMKSGESVMIVDSPDGKRQSLVFADAFMNMPKTPGAPLFVRFAGLQGGPKVPWLIKAAFVKDKKALRAHYERLAASPSLTRIIPTHGHIITSDAAATLKQVAATL